MQNLETGQGPQLSWNRPRQTVLPCHCQKEKQQLSVTPAMATMKQFASRPRTQIKNFETGQGPQLSWNRPRQTVAVCHCRKENERLSETPGMTSME
jgi:hypothetical protein